METNRTFLLTIAIVAALILAGMTGVAQSALVTQSFIGTVMRGPLEGEIGTGTFTYDEDLLVLGEGVFGPTEGLKVSFIFDGQDFDETHDWLYDFLPELVIEEYTPVELDFRLENGVNGVNFKNPLLTELKMLKLLPFSGDGEYDFQTELITTVAPIPAAAWLLGAGLIGLLGLKWRLQL